jgi:dinuclear metal center YbgI/SA1388 family protein
MPYASLAALVRHCDRTLHTLEFDDYEGAVNGLQVANSGRVTRIAATVDATLATVKLAVVAGADLLLVHHGLFWAKTHPWTGPRHELIRRLIENDLAVYSAHLPLDAHPRLGNNALLAAAVGLKNLKPFFPSHGQFIGYQAAARISRTDLVRKLGQAIGGRVTVIPGGPEICRRIGVVSGGAGAELRLAAEAGVDTFITGEGPHWTFAQAEELGINVLYGGHYATETFGVKALAAELAAKFRVPWQFLDYPTGL